MPTEELIQKVEQLKSEMGIDARLASQLSERSESRGKNAGISAITQDEGQVIIESTFDRVVQRIISSLEED